MILRKVVILLSVMFLWRPAAFAKPEPSVLVTTTPVAMGSIPRTVVAYGKIGPGPGASDTLTVAYAGIVKQVDVVPGAAVHQGQPLAMIGTAPSAQAAYAQAVAAEHAAKQTLAHTRALVASHFATNIQLAQAEQAAAAARSARNALRREGSAGTSTILKAPYDGVVATLAAAPGAALLPGAPVLTILRAHSLVATVGLDLHQTGTVKVGDKVAIVPFAGVGAGTLRGTVLAIGAMVDPQSGLVDATIAVPSTKFLVGESVTVTINIGSERGVILPRNAVLPDENAYILWQIKGGHARSVGVRVINRSDRRVVVRGNIDPALPIVVSGNYQLFPGAAVRITH